MPRVARPSGSPWLAISASLRFLLASRGLQRAGGLKRRTEVSALLLHFGSAHPAVAVQVPASEELTFFATSESSPVKGSEEREFFGQ